MTYAVKTIEKCTLSLQTIFLLKREIEALFKMSHPNILQLYEVYEDDKFYHMVTEFCEGGEITTLFGKKGRMTEDNALHIIF